MFLLIKRTKTKYSRALLYNGVKEHARKSTIKKHKVPFFSPLNKMRMLAFTIKPNS